MTAGMGEWGTGLDPKFNNKASERSNAQGVRMKKHRQGKKRKEQGRNKNRQVLDPEKQLQNAAAGRHFVPDEPDAHLPHYPSHG